MKLGLISKIRNEIDIIKLFLNHVDSIFDIVYLLDHKSTDGTGELLQKIAEKNNDWKYYYLDFNGHFHKEVTDYFLPSIFSEGIDYLFFLDSDEFLNVTNRNYLENVLIKSGEGLKNMPGSLHWVNCIPDDFNLKFNTDKNFWVPKTTSIYEKIILSSDLFNLLNGKVYVSQGNHLLLDSNGHTFSQSISIGNLFHFPVRSLFQVQKKAIIKSLAYKAIIGRNNRDGFHNFELLKQISQGSLNDDILRGLTFLYEKERSIVKCSKSDLEKLGYTKKSFENLGIPSSGFFNIEDLEIPFSHYGEIADVILNWDQEIKEDIKFGLEGNRLYILSTSESRIKAPGIRRDRNSMNNNFPFMWIKKINRKLKIILTQILISQSSLFDKEYYLEKNPDVKKAKINPVKHYILFGANEGRNPSLYFDSSKYLTDYPDVRASGMNPLIHYLKFGKFEGRLIFPVVNPSDYSRDIQQINDKMENHLYPTQKILLVNGKFDQKEQIGIDIIICVHDAIDDLKKCLNSVIANIKTHHKIIIVDDASDKETRDYLVGIKKSYDFVKLITNKKQLFYTRSVNIGLKESNADFVILLNSDTIVTTNWADKLCNIAYMDKRFGLVSPLSNAANLQSIPSITPTSSNTAINELPQGISIEKMNLICQRLASEEGLTESPILHGFCLGIKKELIDQIGLFDEKNFPKGYGEEVDFCFRAVDKGYIPVIATNTFIFHSKSKSYSNDEFRKKLMRETWNKLAHKYSKKRLHHSQNVIENNCVLTEIRKKSETQFMNIEVEQHYVDSCSICGEKQIFLKNHQSIREGYKCQVCGATLRERELISVLIECFSRKNSKNLALLVKEDEFRKLLIYEPGSLGIYRKYLKSVPGYITSEYDNKIKSGEVRNGLLYEDLTCLSMPNDHFDIIITADFLEHVRKPYLALQEIYRVLKHNGFHIFSIPVFVPLPPKTLKRVNISSQEDEFILPPVYHNNKHLVYNDFGFDLIEKLKLIGFDTQLISPRHEPINSMITFISKKC